MSLLNPKSIKFDIGGGREVTIETGKMARQADGAVTVRQGNCILLATVVANKEPKAGHRFLAMRRGMTSKTLKVDVVFPEEVALGLPCRL